MMETRTENEPSIAAIADRLRSVLLTRPVARAERLSQLGDELGVSVAQVEELLHHQDKLIDPALLVDLVAAVVRDEAVDPSWLLTGDYDYAIHKGALALAEETMGSPLAGSALRTFVSEQWRSLRASWETPLQFSRARSSPPNVTVDA